MTQVVEKSSGSRASEVRGTAANLASGTASLARGKVIESRPGMVIFQPRGTSYELHLDTGQAYSGPLNKPVQGRLRVRARKLYTVPSGGNFIAPIQGPPRTVQGRVIDISPSQIVLQAGTAVLVDLPAEGHAIDLASGPVEQGAIVNVVAFPGARFEPAGG